MTPHQYLEGVLERNKMLPKDLDTLRGLRDEIETKLRAVYGYTPRFYYGGSYGKDTLVRASYDLDIVMYFPSTESRTVRELYVSVQQTLINAGYKVTPKNVALRLAYDGGFHIDVVPGRSQSTNDVYATLYRNEDNSTRQTSIKIHIDNVRNSNAREIIKLMKLWRYFHSVDWSSFALEQTVISALANQIIYDYGDAMMTVFKFIRDRIDNIRIVDPANSNNIIEMSRIERIQLGLIATHSISAANWNQIVA